MSEKPQLENPSRNTRISEIKPMQDQQRFENHVESRLHELEKLVTGFLDAPCPSLLSERDLIRRIVEELVVKAAALRWIVRVAKHSDGAIRKPLWLDIENALLELEKTAEGLIHEECV